MAADFSLTLTAAPLSLAAQSRGTLPPSAAGSTARATAARPLLAVTLRTTRLREEVVST